MTANRLEEPLKFLIEYKFYRRKGLRPWKSAWRAFTAVQESKRIIKHYGGIIP